MALPSSRVEGNIDARDNHDDDHHLTPDIEVE
jgi:hypothetical protein